MLTSIIYLVSFLTSARKIIFFHTSNLIEFKMSLQCFWRWWKPWIIPIVPKNVYRQYIILICWKWKAKKHPLVMKYTNIATLRQTKLHSVNVQLSVGDRIGMVKERSSTIKIYQVTFLMTLQNKWSKVLEWYVIWSLCWWIYVRKELSWFDWKRQNFF